MLSPQKIRRHSSALVVALGVVLTAFAILASAASASNGGTGGIEGEITVEGGGPLAEVWTCAYLAQSEGFEENCDFTGSNGLYSIDGLKAGEYKVEFWPEATEPSYVGEYYDDKPFWEEADEVEVEEGVAKTGIDAELAEGATIEGEVRAALLGGPLGDADAVVCASLPSGEPAGCALTRSNGTYVLSGLPAGEYKVAFVPDSSTYNLLNQFYDHKREPAEADPLDVAAGETKTGIDADLEMGAEIHGTVYSAASGTPIPRALACALFLEEAEEAWSLSGCARTSNTGSYEIFGLPSTSYKVVFSPEFKEFFGEEVFEHEDDGYFKQYFDRKPTLAEASQLDIAAPEVRTGIDGFLQPEHPATFPVAPVAKPVIVSTRSPRRTRSRCRPGFRKKKVNGKQRCVKVHKRHRHRRHHRSA
jgi:hypothetical protein